MSKIKVIGAEIYHSSLLTVICVIVGSILSLPVIASMSIAGKLLTSATWGDTYQTTLDAILFSLSMILNIDLMG